MKVEDLALSMTNAAQKWKRELIIPSASIFGLNDASLTVLRTR